MSKESQAFKERELDRIFGHVDRGEVKEAQTALAVKLLKAAASVTVDPRFSTHYLNGFAMAKADILTALRAKLAELGIEVSEK